MKVDRQKLVNALGIVMPAVGGIETTEPYRCVHFNGPELRATNSIMIKSTVIGEEYNFYCSVPGKQLLAVLQKMPDEKVDVALTKGKMVIKGAKGKIKGKLTVESSELEITVPEYKSTNNKKKLTQLLEALSFCRYHVSHDEGEGQYCGVHIDGKKIMATDLMRLSKYVIDKEVFSTPCTVPVEFINELVRTKDELLNLKLDGNKLVACYKNDTVMCTVLMGGEYPDLDQYFPDKDQEFTYVEFPDTLAPVLDRHIAFLKSTCTPNMFLEVVIEGVDCTITSREDERGELVEKLSLASESEALDRVCFHINPSFWKDVCAITNSFNYSDGRILFLTDKLSYMCNEAVEVE